MGTVSEFLIKPYIRLLSKCARERLGGLPDPITIYLDISFLVCGAPGRLRHPRGPHRPPRMRASSAHLARPHTARAPRTAFMALQRGFQPRSPLRSKELLRHAPPSTSGMKNAPGKRPQTDTKSPTVPAAPVIDRSPAAKVQALPNDGSDLLTPSQYHVALRTVR